MKELILVRHAKSDWTNESITDIDRPLNERGYTDAYQLSDWYQQDYDLPQLIISSPATRAINTAFIFTRSFGLLEASVKIESDLYESPVKEYLKVISKLDDSYNQVMIFGHNPAITNLTNELNHELLFENIPTCGIVKIEFSETSWKGVVDNKNGKLIINKFPKSFK